ncbi:YcaO-like family protein [Rhizobium sp. S96]|uniref:YcaO-like family protein n=1 Tax=Rhizobium sp. S96 TaxID=3055140 RepID=UPI0025AB01B5|nr:YcaO-like family protein [Rhizobium sp. S96]MDM9620599.1 YcaO-like family protein [Rhizobium sp. S96]
MTPSWSDRSVPPSETLSRVGPILADFGITRVARHTGLDCLGIPVWCAYTPNARSIAIAQGKGISDQDARASAVMEALERAVAGDPTVTPVRSSALSLGEAGQTVETLDCLIGLNQADIDPGEEIAWVCGKELLTGTDIFVPFDAILLDRTRASRFWMSSDGLASGNTMDEAVLHGVLERIERDAHVLWQIESDAARGARCVDPRGLNDAVIDELVAKIETAGLDLRLFDMTSDIPVPCFTAILASCGAHRDENARFVEATGGSGCHPSPARAAIRAITEAAQSRLTYISGARDDVSPETFRKPLPAATRRALQAVPRPPVVTAPGVLTSVSGVSQLLGATLATLRECNVGLVIAVQLSDPALPFCVTKVFMPSLENPEGSRARRFGERAISKALAS